MFKNIKGFFEDIKEISSTLKNIYLYPNHDYRIHYDLQSIANKLEGINKLEQSKLKINDNDKISHPVWIMNADKNIIKLTNDIKMSGQFILVDGQIFAKYSSEQQAQEDFIGICDWIASSNPNGTGVYQLTNTV
jgi:uncharacterized protein (DUF1015 family)